MEEHIWSFDICIVCALHEEAEAVLNEFSLRCHVSFTEDFSGMDRYAYHHTTIQNKRREPLTVLVTWLSDSGPTQTGLDLKPVWHEFRPRFVAMTGFCAGDKRKVKLGDLVVAQYAYYYEEGKIIREAEGPSHHLPEMKTADPTSQVIHYARGFNGWKELIREMKRNKLKRQLRANEEPRCVVAPMASGMAVRGDDPFPWLREKFNRNTVALDMEAATFYRSLRAVSHIHGLVVKGVCDYADMSKNDAYHDYAARASAVYLLSFIQEYVTEQTMPRRDVPLPSSRAGPTGVWNVPQGVPPLSVRYPQPFLVPPLPPHGVVGRMKDVARISKLLVLSDPHAAEVPPVALRGMGGVGKTTLAIWLGRREDLLTLFPDGVLWAELGPNPIIRALLNNWGRALGVDLIPEQDESACRDRLRDVLSKRQVLLIVDDVWEVEHGSFFLVAGSRCRTLFTTRETLIAHALATRSRTLAVDVLSLEDALGLLGRLAPEAVAADQASAQRLCDKLEYLPLAIKLAGRLLANEADVPQRMQRLVDELAEQREARLALEQLEGRKGLAEDRPVSLKAILGLSVKRLNQLDQERFAQLSVFGGEPLTWEIKAAASVWECSQSEAEATTARLIQRGIVEPRPEERYWMHALLADYAEEMMEELGL